MIFCLYSSCQVRLDPYCRSFQSGTVSTHSPPRGVVRVFIEMALVNKISTHTPHARRGGITQNVDDLLQSHTARTMLANSEFIIMLNQASTDRLELAKLLNISDLQMSYITNVEAGHGLIKVGSSLVPFANKFPKNTKLYKLMTTKPGESA